MQTPRRKQPTLPRTVVLTTVSEETGVHVTSIITGNDRVSVRARRAGMAALRSKGYGLRITADIFGQKAHSGVALAERMFTEGEDTELVEWARAIAVRLSEIQPHVDF